MRENSAILLEDDYLQKYEGFDPNSTESYIIFEFMQNKHMEQSVDFASYIQNEFVNEKRIDRGVKQGGLLVLRKTSMPAVLVELGFMSNREEERYMASDNGTRRLSNAIYKAFNRYKDGYDRKQGVLGAASKEEPSKSSSVSMSNMASDGIVYKIQILTTSKKIPTNSRELKGYKNVNFFEEKGLYKYTYGETTSLNEIQSLKRKVEKDFKGAFVVQFKDGKKIK